MSDPVRADHRFLSFINRFFCDGKLRLNDRTRAVLIRAFELGGGSWVRLFQGSLDDVVLLKKLARAQLLRQKDW